MFLIGTVEFAEYLKIIATVESSIQLGDMAVPKFGVNMIPPQHKLIQGNKYDVSLHPNCIGEMWLEDGVLVAHDCPAIAVPKLGGEPNDAELDRQSVFDRWRPRVWVFSHWNVSLEFELESCRFISLARGQYYDFNNLA